MNAPNIIRTSLELNGDLLNEAMKLGGTNVKKHVIENALREYVTSRKRKDLYDLFNSGEKFLDDDYDYKAHRGSSHDFS
jgi:Arc/MetJ family transcription regulator